MFGGCRVNFWISDWEISYWEDDSFLDPLHTKHLTFCVDCLALLKVRELWVEPVGPLQGYKFIYKHKRMVLTKEDWTVITLLICICCLVSQDHSSLLFTNNLWFLIHVKWHYAGGPALCRWTLSFLLLASKTIHTLLSINIHGRS